MQTFLNLAAGSLLLIALLAYYFTVFKPLQNEKALKQEEEKRQAERLLQRAFSEKFTPGCNDFETLEDFEERYN